MSNCNHPNHQKILEESIKNPTVYAREDGSKKIIGPLTDIYINTKKYGKICGECWAHEIGAIIEEHPITGPIDEKKNS